VENNKLLLNQLVQAVIENDTLLVVDLLSRGIDPNATLDADNVTLLHYAAQNNALEVIPLLVEAGATIQAKTIPDGYTPIAIALLHGHHRIAQTLITYINSPDNGQLH